MGDRFFLLDAPRSRSLERLAALARRAVGADVGLVTLIDGARQVFKAADGLPEPVASTRETALDHSICVHVAAMDVPLIVENALAHPLMNKNPAVRDFGILAYIGCPIHAPSGQPVGAVCAISHRIRPWSDPDLMVLKLVAQLVDAEIETTAAKANAA